MKKTSVRRPAAAPSTRRAARSRGNDPRVERLRQFVERSLDDDKAQDVVTIELAGKSAIADYMIVASGTSQRHINATTHHLLERLKAEGFGGVRAEGLNACDWVLVDAGDVIVHLFLPEVRSFYNLEKMWAAELPPEQVAV